jgi:urease accessory protein
MPRRARITMATTTDTTLTDGALLQLIWLASPALPVGGFSYSEGLEAAVEAGLVKDEATAAGWIVDQLHASLARSDLAVLVSAVEAARASDAARVAQLDAWVRQTRETSELRQQTEQMGRSMAEWERSLGVGVRLRAHHRPTGDMNPDTVTGDMNPDTVTGDVNPDTVTGDVNPDTVTADVNPVGRGDARNPDTARSDSTFPVAFALAAANTTASPRQITLTYAFAWSENMMQSAIKTVPLGQSAGQRILAQLAREIPLAVDHALSLADADRQSFTPMLAILSAQHETQYSRLFRS